MTEEDKKVALETSEKVSDLVNKVKHILAYELQKEDPQSAWFIYGRVINSLYATHHGAKLIITKDDPK